MSTNNAVIDEVVVPPGGPRSRRHVHRVESREKFSFERQDASRLLQNPAGAPPLRREDRPGPPDSANWITCAGWSNTTGQPITSFTTTWIVPPPPTTQASQLIYFFNGIEPADGSAILQPVLQWGDSGADQDGQNRTGNFWTVSSWLVGGPQNNAIHTPHIPVNTGDTLTGSITLVGRTAEGFAYECEFSGLEGTTLTPPPMSELTWCVQTLEAYELNTAAQPPYDLNDSSEYPASNSIWFDAINVVIGATGPLGGWLKRNFVTNYGEDTLVVSDSTALGRVEIKF